MHKNENIAISNKTKQDMQKVLMRERVAVTVSRGDKRAAFPDALKQLKPLRRLSNPLRIAGSFFLLFGQAKRSPLQ